MGVVSLVYEGDISESFTFTGFFDFGRYLRAKD